MVYEPREDSHLLQEAVGQHASGKVLDMGCGSGIQGRTALEKDSVSLVWFVDLDPEAIRQVKRDIDDPRARFLLSDLFEKVSGTFDTIIFNPPYLPDHEQLKDIALDGGPEGWEITSRFLGQARPHLASEGSILLLISSLTGKQKVESLIEEQGFRFSIEKEKGLDHERLYLYVIRHG